MDAFVAALKSMLDQKDVAFILLAVGLWYMWKEKSAAQTKYDELLKSIMEYVDVTGKSHLKALERLEDDRREQAAKASPTKPDAPQV
jgi:hypothetical protein